ncbi:conserved repeat domain-containing protein [Actinosynnema pretiosum]|nr:conserved repeat domain-containing protein [Actinosynnema pretiosum]
MTLLAPGRRLLAAATSFLIAAGVSVGLAPLTAEAAVERAFTLNYNEEVYGDFVEAGNGNSSCPDASAPTDPFGEAKANCAGAQARTLTAAANNNDSYYMQWADVDSNAATFNSSRGSVTIPPGSRVAYARLNWSGDTGSIKLSTGAVSTAPGCNTRQFQSTAGTAVVPSGTPESTSTVLTIGGGAPVNIAPQVITRDALANVPSSQPQFYSAYADVTSRFQNLPSGTANTITLGNVWTPQGFGCYSGWSLVLVYAYDAPNTDYAPTKREIFLYDGHVRQSSTDAATTIPVTGFRVAATPVRIGLTAYEGDFNISGDRFVVNGTAQPALLDPSNTNNFWVSNGQNSVSPNVPNNMSVDAKVVETSSIAVGDTSAQLTFTTAGDTYLAQNLVFSVPVPAIYITKDTTGGPYRPGEQIPFTISVVAPGASRAVNVTVTDPSFADCNRAIGTLLPNVPVTYTCTGPAPDTSGTNIAYASGGDDFGGVVESEASKSFTVIHPAIDITKTADKTVYAAGETITFTISVANTGDAPLTNVNVSDPKVPACARPNQNLAVGARFTYTCTTTAPLAGDSNTATAAGADPAGKTVSDTATVVTTTPGSISGRVFNDRDDDGLYEPENGGTGIQGVTVTLSGTSGTGTAVNQTTTTTSDGSYSFAGVPAGAYTVAETQPADYDDGKDTPGTFATSAGNDRFTVTLPQNGSSVGNDFAELAASSLAGTVYNDLNVNGVLEPGEPGIGGVTLTLTGTDSAGNPVRVTTLTAADGTYRFDRLRQGTYNIEEDHPSTYQDGQSTPGTVGGTPTSSDIADINLPSRTAATGYNFADYLLASLNGSVVDEHDDPIPNVRVVLTGPDGSKETTTADNGVWLFDGLRPGTYSVVEFQPPGYADGPETVGDAGGVNSDNDVFSGIVLRSGQTGSGYVFQEFPSSIGGVVYEDRNGNGARDAGEPGIRGVVVTLSGTSAAGRPVNQTTRTNFSGDYLFDDIPGGRYSLTETQPAGYLDGRETAGDAGGFLTPPDTISAIDLPAGYDATGYLFGETIAASIAGRVVDNLGAGIPNTTITVTNTDGFSATVRTDASGAYSVLNLPPGTYTVTETQPTGYGDGPDTVGSAGGANSANDVISGIVITSNTAATGYDFAEAFSSLAGTVYRDDNNNGVREPGEVGIGGVTVTLTGNDAFGAPVNRTETTAQDGSYFFCCLIAGTYTLTETAPAGYIDGRDTPGTAGGRVSPPDSITQISLPPGVAGTDYLFGNTVIAGIAGRVVDDAGAGIPNVTINLFGPTNLTTTTDATGSYLFANLPPGTYTLVEVQPTGYGDGADTVGSAGGNIVTSDVIGNIRLTSGAAATGYDFAETRSSLAGSVYVDANGNGARDAGETGIAGVAVTLTGTDDAGNAVNRPTTTAADGGYSFTGLLSGDYRVDEAQPAGYLDGADTPGTAGGTATPPDSITAIDLPAGNAATGYLFGESSPSGITGRVVDDAGNGVPGVTITLTGPGAGGPTATTTTGPDGSYAFTGLTPGSYTITETQPVGYGDGPDAVGTAGGTNSPNDTITGIPVTSGSTASGYVFAETRSAIAGSVYDDRNGDGARDPGDTGIGGVLLTLTGTDALGAAVNRTTTTAANGDYSFTGLLSGTYRIDETQPAGYLDGINAVGTAGGTLVPPDTIDAITLPVGTAATAYLFGETVQAGISGRVVDDAGTGIPGVTVTLTGPNGSGTTQTTTTGPDGSYAFTDLLPGTYVLTESQPAGYGDGSGAVGAAGGASTDPNTIGGITVDSGTAATGYDFTDTRGSLSGAVYTDVNGSGSRDPGEPGIEGVLVTLTGTDATGASVNRTATTNATGDYSFTGLLSGTYAVTETQPAGYLDGAETPGSEGGTITPPDSITAITLPVDADAVDYLFGESVAAGISGRVVDELGDGIPGVTITLTGPTSATTTTGPDGSYAFADLLPGSYSIVETQPVGYGDGPETVGTAGGDDSLNDEFTGITIDSATAAVGYVFAEKRGSLAGAVYVDNNGNGVRDPGEPGIGGVTVDLTGADALGNPVTASVVSDPDDGSYLFPGLLSGTYSVTETQPAGYLDGTEAEGTSGGTVTPPDSITAIDLAEGVDATGYLFGDYVASSITGRVVDEAGNGIAGVGLSLSGPGATGTTAVTTTGPDGSWTFTGLVPGLYTVIETQPAGYGDGPDTPGLAGGDTTINDEFVDIPVTSGSAPSGYVFAEKRGSLAGLVFEDDNGDGVRDPGEPAIGGVTVTLTGTDVNGDVSLTQVTDTAGGYSFTGLLTGDYTVTETQPAGFLDGIDTAGTSGGTPTPPDSITGVDLIAGADATGYTFGELIGGTLSGRVVDESGNGIEGVTITLDGPTPATTTTGPDGSYSFTGLQPGQYTITETQPTGYADAGGTVGSAGGTPTGDVIGGITVGSGTVGAGYDFTDKAGSLAGSVYVDANGNGLRDAGEDGVAGVTVTLTGTDDTGADVNRTALTEADGSYLFDGLLSGTYAITETQPAGYLDGIDAPGTAGATVTPPDSLTAIDLAAGDDATGYTFGEQVAASLSGRVADEAGNGIPGVTVTLNGPTTATTVTGPDGSYSFTGLVPGAYTVVESQPNGYGDGPDTAGSAGGGTDVNDQINGIVLGSDTRATGYDFTDTRGSIAGSVYEDVNGNGARDSGEPGIGSVQVTLTGTDALGRPVSTTVLTDPAGGYTFTGVVGGTYTVTETQPGGYLDGADTPGTAGGTATPPDSITGIALGGGQNATGYLFGESAQAGISGRVVDQAGNGIAGVTITLTGPTTATVVTDASGGYAFTDLPPGTYTVTETQPANYGDGPDTVGTAGGDASVNDVFSGIVINSGTVAAGYVFAEVQGSISGAVYYDANGNGVRDAGEVGIPNATVTLTDAAGDVDLLVTTANDGSYSFAGLPPGTYTIVETTPTGYDDGQETIGSAGGTLVPPDSIANVQLAAGQSGEGYLFGEIGDVGGVGNPGEEVSIGGVVFLDANGNGVIDPTETTRLADVVITLKDSTGQELELAATDANGAYEFTLLPEGTYTVVITQPAGYGSTTPAEVTVTVPAGGTGVANFGEQLGLIGDYVWDDENGNGIQDAGEKGVAGVVVVLKDASGAEITRVTTGANGEYGFTGLAPGQYLVTVLSPTGTTLAKPGQGADRALDSDFDQTTATSAPLTIAITGGRISQLTDVDAALIGSVVDLTIGLTVDKPAAQVGDTVTFTDVVSNDGNVPVVGATTTITLPEGLKPVTATGDGWECEITGQVVTCTTEAVVPAGGSLPPVTVVSTATAPMTATDAVAEVVPAVGVSQTNTDNDVAVVAVEIAQPATTTPPTTTTTTPPAAVATPAPPAQEPLAWTGVQVAGMVLGGLALLVAGLGALVMGRRRRGEHL